MAQQNPSIAKSSGDPPLTGPLFEMRQRISATISAIVAIYDRHELQAFIGLGTCESYMLLQLADKSGAKIIDTGRDGFVDHFQYVRALAIGALSLLSHPDKRNDANSVEKTVARAIVQVRVLLKRVVEDTDQEMELLPVKMH